MYTVWQQLKPHLILKRLFRNNNPQSNLKTSQNIVVIAVSVVRLFSKLQGFHYQRNLVFPALLRSSLPTFRRSSSTAFRWFDNFNLSDWSLTFSLFCCSTWPFTSQKWGPTWMDHSIFFKWIMTHQKKGGKIYSARVTWSFYVMFGLVSLGLQKAFKTTVPLVDKILHQLGWLKHCNLCDMIWCDIMWYSNFNIYVYIYTCLTSADWPDFARHPNYTAVL